MKNTYFAILLFSGALSYAQVGIHTKNPQSSLDVTSLNATGTTANVDGLLVPRVDRQRAQSMKGIPTSTLIYVNNISTGSQTGTTANVDDVGYYYFNGTIWVKMHNPTNSSFTSNNIYNSDGTLTGNRVVTQNNKTLTFNGTAVNTFSVDGSTFSVDAANKRVGVGTTTPSAKLDVQGNQLINAAVSTVNKNALDFNIGQDGYTYGNRTDNYGIRIKSISSVGSGNVSRINFGDTATSGANGTKYLSFSVGSQLNELMYLTDANNGKVGIGTTTPGSKLDVTTGNNGEVRIGTGTGNSLWAFQPSDNSGKNNADVLNIINRTDNKRSMVLSSTGDIYLGGNIINNAGGGTPAVSIDGATENVGIGTSSPTTKLHVNSGSSPAVKIVDGTQGAGKVLTSDASGNASWQDLGGGSNTISVNVANVKFPFVNVNSRDNGTYTLDSTNAPNYTIWVTHPSGTGVDVNLPSPISQERRTINIIAAGDGANSKSVKVSQPMYITDNQSIDTIPAGKRVILNASNTFGGKWYIVMKDF